MWVVIMLLPSLAFTSAKAQDTLVLDIGKALEIALSENPTVKVANKEIQKKKYAQKGSYAALFPQVSFAADYNRTLKKQVMYMDGFDMGSTEIPGMEDMPNYVYKDGKVSYEKVELGRRMGNKYEVISGVNSGDQVVVSGQSRLNNGMEVEIEK